MTRRIVGIFLLGVWVYASWRFYRYLAENWLRG